MPPRKSLTDRLPRFRVSTRIALGFLVVLGLHVCIAIVAHVGQDQATRDLEVQNALRKKLIASSDLDTAVRELERGVLLYVQTGTRSTAARTVRLHETIQQRLQVLAVGDRGEHVTRMLGHLQRHRELYDAVIRDRDTRDRLVRETLRPAYNRIQASLDALVATGDANVMVPALRGQNRLREAQIATLRFLAEPDSELVARARRQLAELRTEFDQIERHAPFPCDAAHAGAVSEYENALIAMVQATRAYLYLVNVAMAGETAEFLRLSGQVRAASTESINRLTEAMGTDHRQFAFASNAIAVGTIILGLLAGVWISRSIAPPLQQITSTLRDLAAGRETPVIPYAGRRDEIGEISAAAQVFRGRSEQIEELLAQARASEQELRRKEEALSTRNAELDQFTYVASHDLQEPLRKLLSFSQLLPIDLGGDLPEKAATDLRYITDAAHRMKVLVQDLLLFARSGNRDLHCVPVSLDTCVDNALEVLSDRIDADDPLIRRDPLPQVNGDAALLTQLYQNLIGNALKFVRPGQRVELHLTAERRGDECVLGVRDNGIGIDAAYAEMIFAPFKRLHARANYEGTGIGLAICEKVVHRHGGRIWVESEPDRGAHFRFTLAACQCAERPETPATVRL